jgi:hypothetical protein
MLASFPQSGKLKPGETVVFAWIVYTSRVHRDRVNAGCLKGPRVVSMMGETPPWDGKRMFWVDARCWWKAEFCSNRSCGKEKRCLELSISPGLVRLSVRACLKSGVRGIMLAL